MCGPAFEIPDPIPELFAVLEKNPEREHKHKGTNFEITAKATTGYVLMRISAVPSGAWCQIQSHAITKAGVQWHDLSSLKSPPPGFNPVLNDMDPSR
ncbi:hypothetical protein AAY473_016759 [Plecturocebus cupreus]